MVEYTKSFTKCKDEQSFKYAFLKEKYSNSQDYIFPIETEETIKGFPDVLIVEKGSNISFFLEFKYTEGNTIKFRKGQLAFYRKYKELPIYIVSYKAKENKVVLFPAHEIFNMEGEYAINLNLEVKI